MGAVWVSWPPEVGAPATETDMTESAIEWVHLDLAAPNALQVGDVVSAAAGGLPTYRVVALADQQAWVRDDDHAAIRLLPISRLHWKIGAWRAQS